MKEIRYTPHCHTHVLTSCLQEVSLTSTFQFKELVGWFNHGLEKISAGGPGFLLCTWG